MNDDSESETSSLQQTTPWAPAMPALGGILGNIGQVNPNLTATETNALDRMTANANAGNPYAPAIGGVANTLLGGGGPDRTGMVNDAYAQYRAALAPTASGAFLDPSTNPFFGNTTSNIADSVISAAKDQFAGAGRDPSGAGSFAGTIGREVASALAPMYGQAYDAERGRQLAAITGMYGAGGQTAGLLSGLDQTRLGNMQAGITAADAANMAQNWGPMQILQIEAQRRGIPLETMAAQMGVVLPAAQAFGTTTGNQKTTKTLSDAETLASYGKMFGSAPSGKV
jgi:hypothetical protein